MSCLRRCQINVVDIIPCNHVMSVRCGLTMSIAASDRYYFGKFFPPQFIGFYFSTFFPRYVCV